MPTLGNMIQKVLNAEEIIRLKEKLEQENLYLTDEIKQNYNFDKIIGSSNQMQDVYLKVTQVRNTDVTVLITGETGTGKELVARAIHNSSDRKDHIMVKINCATLPAQLIESELFGHEKGSFTGAFDKRVGKFELAHKSTIFLDEIGELPLELQPKLLRVLQEKEFERLGGNKTIKTDIRVIAATNRDLEAEVQAGKFRSDLYYRLSVFPIELPPLRERKDDIPVLATHFLEKYSLKFNKPVEGFSTNVLNELLQSFWAGNVRELEHVLERAVLLAQGKVINNLYLSKKQLIKLEHEPNAFIPKALAETEREYIINVLKSTNGRIRGAGGAAEVLDLKPTTLESKMKKLGVGKIIQ
jgi:transcriptional regulator with GAF, ATPase, and Fis domain